MKRSELASRICSNRLMFEGGMGTMLIDMGLKAGEAPESWNLSHPERILSVHKQYIAAGANILKTNTFGVSSLKYDNYRQLISAAVSIAKEAAESGEDILVAYDMGPLGRLLSPFGDLDFEQAVSVFRASAAVAASEGADLILIETMNDCYETRAAVIGAKEACELPIIVTNVYDERAKLMTGADPEAMIAMLESLGVTALGMNCSLGPEKMLDILPRFLESASVPVVVCPNAGMPSVIDGVTVFDYSAEDFSRVMLSMARLGAHILGGCCGTTPEHIRLTCEKIRDIDYIPPTEKDLTRVSSYTHAVSFGGAPVLIGERINPTGKPKLKAALREGDLGYIVSEALGEEDAGAEVLDVNVGLPEIDEPDMMCRVIREIMAVSSLPIQIDSSSAEALESAMRIVNGKPLVNSVNGKREVMDKVFSAVKKYGGTVIALTLDEQGIPSDAEGRVRIAEKIIAYAAEWGIKKKDIIVDPLALAVSSDPNSARVTLDSIKMLTERGIKTSLGVSNISFGLPDRDKINSAFFVMAMESGLSAAIMNPYSEGMMSAYRAFKALSGHDAGCSEYIECASGNKAEPMVAPVSPSSVDLFYAVRRGMVETAAALAHKALLTNAPLDIINGQIIPALNDIGEAFDKGKAYLPELLRSAESAAAAFAVVKENIPSSERNGRTVVLATVKGDIHDIGKNIVRVLLESYGFTVLDLGRDVPHERLVSAVLESRAELVGLSALMTTTVESMREAIAELRAACPLVKIMVGGAVLTEDYAKMIGADFYGRDAMEAVRIAERCAGGGK